MSSGHSEEGNEEETRVEFENEDEEDIPDGDLGSVNVGLLEACKLVRFVRRASLPALFDSKTSGLCGTNRSEYQYWRYCFSVECQCVISHESSL